MDTISNVFVSFSRFYFNLRKYYALFIDYTSLQATLLAKLPTLRVEHLFDVIYAVLPYSVGG